MELTSVSGTGANCTDLSYEEDGYYPYTVTEPLGAALSFEYTVKEIDKD
jgi:hypothetical protein